MGVRRFAQRCLPAGQGALLARALVRSQVLYLQTSLFRKNFHRRRAKGYSIMIRKEHVGISRPFQNPVRRGTLAFQPPPGTKYGGQCSFGLGGWPMLNWFFRRQ